MKSLPLPSLLSLGKRSLAFLLSIGIVSLAALCQPANAAVLVYRVDFKKIEESVNYPKPSFGYFFIDPDAGTVTSVTVLVNPFSGEAYYSTSLLSGNYFQTTPFFGKTPQNVLAASSGAGGTEQAFLQISGPASGQQNIGGKLRYPISNKLQGYLLLSASDQDPLAEADSPSSSATPTPTATATATATPTPTATPSTTTISSSTATTIDTVLTTVQQIDAELGYFGYAKVTAKFQRLYTRQANDNTQGASDVSAAIIKTLEAMGIKSSETSSSSSSSSSSTSTATATPTATATATATATPTP